MLRGRGAETLWPIDSAPIAADDWACEEHAGRRRRRSNQISHPQFPDTMKTASKKATGKNSPAKATRAGSSAPAVDAVFNAYPKPIKARLLALRRLIFDTARTTSGVGALQETLKWGQPSYLTTETKSGSTIRIDQVKSAANQYAVYFHCQTDLVETFRELYPELSYGGNRSIVLKAQDDLPEAPLRHCVALALTYHLNKRKAARAK
jgi:hypothetical protein